MIEKRRSQRIKYLGTGWLHYKGTQNYCRLKNISMHGAMVGLKTAPIGSINHGDSCTLKLYRDAEEPQYTDFLARIIRLESDVAGLEFIEIEGSVKDVLESIAQKEQHFFGGADTIINRAQYVAYFCGVELSDVHFDNGELIPEREMHTLRLFAGNHSARVHFSRSEIEGFYVLKGTSAVHNKIFKTLATLHDEVTANAATSVVACMAFTDSILFRAPHVKQLHDLPCMKARIR